MIDERYPLVPLPTGGYRQRTRLNVVDSDGTAILYAEALSGGTRLTRNLCALENRPYVLVDALKLSEAAAILCIADFVDKHGIRVLNVAGPRASKWTEGQAFTKVVLAGVIGRHVERLGGRDSDLARAE